MQLFTELGNVNFLRLSLEFLSYVMSFCIGGRSSSFRFTLSIIQFIVSCMPFLEQMTQF